MPDYSQSKIYKIVNDDNDNFYIGSTIQPLYKRMHHHRSKHHSCMSKKIGVDLKDCIIVLVEKIECKDKQELHKRERYYIEKYREEGLNIVNKIIPGRTDKEYYQDNKEERLRKSKQHYEKNKEKRNQQQKENYEKNKEHYKKKSKEYREENKEKIKEYRDKNKEKNYEKMKEYYKEYTKEYYEKNKDRIAEKAKQKIKCVCGAIIQKSNNKHIKSKKHISYIENENK